MDLLLPVSRELRLRSTTDADKIKSLRQEAARPLRLYANDPDKVRLAKVLIDRLEDWINNKHLEE